MSNWRVDSARASAPSQQIVESVLDALACDELGGGAKLPSVRGMAGEALVNHNTAARAYRELEHLGVVEGQNGLGVFVTRDGPRIARELRRGQTLAAFVDAVDRALRSGHDLDALWRVAQVRQRRSA